MRERADIATMLNSIREALRAAGPDMSEKKLASGVAFMHASGRAVGQVEERAGTLRARLWLPDRERAALETRPTFDRVSGWLHVVSEEDVAFVKGLAGAAYRAAAKGNGSPPNAAARSEAREATAPTSGGRPSRSPAARPSGTTARTRR